MRHARPRQRQAQAEQSRQHALAAGEGGLAFTPADHIGHAAETRLRPFSGVKEAAWPERESASEASTKVQEVAANMQQAAATRKRITGRKAESIARRYFAAIDARDLEQAVSLWAQDGRENVRGQVDTLSAGGRA